MGTGLVGTLETTEPVIAAVMSLSPADACSIAAKLSLRYAIQCWEDPAGGKAIFWKPAVALQGLYRVEFKERDGHGLAGEKRGLLRVTLVWDGRPLHVYCAQLSDSPRSADWQLVQLAREVEGARGATILVADPGGARLPAWPRLPDAEATALWRSIAYPQGADIGAVARVAFGIDPVAQHGALERGEVRGRIPRVFCSSDFSVHRVCQAALPDVGGTGGAAFVDLMPAADGDDGASHRTAAVGGSIGEPVDRTGTYSV